MIEVKEIEYCKSQVTYIADQAVISKKVEETIDEIRKLPVPGFRPGKATDIAIKTRYKQKINDYVKQKMLTHAYEDILYETKMEPIGLPQPLDVKFNGQNFSCELLFWNRPSFEMKDIRDIEIPKPHETVTEIEYSEKLLQELRLNHGDTVPYQDTDFIQMGDAVILEFEITQNDKSLIKENGKLYTIGSNEYVGFDDNLLGMNVGENREFDIIIDGSPAHVKTNLHMGTKKIPCALDDSLATKVGLKTLDELRNTVAGVAANRLKMERDRKILEQIKAKLVLEYDFKIPQWLTTMEVENLKKVNKLEWDTLSDEDKEAAIVQAEKNVRYALILDSLRKKEPESDLSDDEVIKILKNNLMQQNQNPENWFNEAQKSGQLAMIMINVRNQFSEQFMVDKVKLIE